MPKTPKLTEPKVQPLSKDDIGNPQDFRHIVHMRSSSISHNMQRLHVFDNVEEGERMTSTDQTQRSSKSNADLSPLRDGGKYKHKHDSVFYDLENSKFSDLDVGKGRSRLSRNMSGMVGKLMHVLKKEPILICPNQNDDNSLRCRNNCDVSPELPPKLVSLYKDFPRGLSQIPPKAPHLLLNNEEFPVSSIQDEDMGVKPVPKKRIESAKAEEDQEGPAIRIYRI
ncbi:unnamed protein product [Bursaphelenchus xylophilus]|uniref:(pine wood nematode) hypothetical protein n=1 Tax=Bursaphelenchus xylophilus TaxID=6326 RepID=A0A1I7RZM5_BURXY|nr:unnamed protein product [Bursaphelenchus xylophilus]CAG9111415.1 unnamed protein product [Bursaphelenchus xylophilus]